MNLESFCNTRHQRRVTSEQGLTLVRDWQFKVLRGGAVGLRVPQGLQQMGRRLDCMINKRPDLVVLNLVRRGQGGDVG